MRRRKDVLFSAAALVIVVVVLALGFRRLGPPRHQRATTADARRVSDLHEIAQRIAAMKLLAVPASLAGLRQSRFMNLNDPATRAPYEYHPKSCTVYELCATFATASAEGDYRRPLLSRFWWHPKGRYCYQLDGSKEPEWLPPASEW
jgi:hypothetical protein